MKVIYYIVLFYSKTVLCHGIPNLRPLEEGDFINLDITLYKNGVHGDNSVMGMIGKVDNEVLDLISVTQKMLYESIKICKPGEKYSRIGEICQEIADSHDYSICNLFTGHGIGSLLHLPPMVQHTCILENNNLIKLLMYLLLKLNFQFR